MASPCLYRVIIHGIMADFIDIATTRSHPTLIKTRLYIHTAKNGTQYVEETVVCLGEFSAPIQRLFIVCGRFFGAENPLKKTKKQNLDVFEIVARTSARPKSVLATTPVPIGNPRNHDSSENHRVRQLYLDVVIIARRS